MAIQEAVGTGTKGLTKRQRLEVLEHLQADIDERLEVLKQEVLAEDRTEQGDDH